MGRDIGKENQNVYFKARKQAAEWDERLASRENASELLGVAAYTLGDYELGNVKRVPPEKVLLMSDLYNAPWLLTNYCVNECPIHGFLPMATEENGIEGIALRLLKDLKTEDLKVIKDQLIDITNDGVIDDKEVQSLQLIMEHLSDLAYEISELKIVAEKCLKKKETWI